MQFFQSAITTLQTLTVALGAGLGAWGVINLMEGYGNDNPGAKSQGIKQLMAGGGIALIGTTLIRWVQKDQRRDEGFFDRQEEHIYVSRKKWWRKFQRSDEGKRKKNRALEKNWHFAGYRSGRVPLFLFQNFQFSDDSVIARCEKNFQSLTFLMSDLFARRRRIRSKFSSSGPTRHCLRLLNVLCRKNLTRIKRKSAETAEYYL